MKLPLLILVILILLTLTAHLLIEMYENEITDYITGRIEKKSKERYTIRVNSADLNLLSRSVTIRELTIAPEMGKITKTAAHVRISELHIEGISLWELAINKTLNARLISIKEGQLQLTHANGEPIVIIPSFEGKLGQSKLGKRISFKEAALIMSDPEYHTRDGFYRLSAGSLKLHTTGTMSMEASIAGFRLTPRYRRYEFSRKKGYMCNRVEFTAATLSGADLDFDRLLNKREIFCREVTVQRPGLDIFRNRKMRRRPGPRKDRFPRQLLQRIRVPFSLDRLIVEKGELEYSELSPGGRLPGGFALNDLNMELDHLTNHPQRIEEGAVLKLSASGLLMGSGKFQALIRVPLNKTDDTFAATGSVGPMDPRVLNRLLIRTANTRIDRGKLDGLTFSMTGNQTRISGEMKLRYHDLKISLLKKGASDKKRWLTSFVANRIIPSHNPKPGRPLRVGRIYYLKEKPVSFFTYMGRALLSGLKSSTRLKRKKR